MEVSTGLIPELSTSASSCAVPRTSPQRLSQSASPDPSRPDPRTVLYLAYGSNMAAATFLGMRGIRPLSQVTVSVPDLRLTFGLRGVPYWEPCFANVDFRGLPEKDYGQASGEWDGRLMGVVYEVTLSDFGVIMRTEGAGASYREITVPCFPIKSGSGPQDDVRPFQARTLHAPQQANDKGVSKHAGAQPSSRYLKLLRDGAREHGLPGSYQSYLRSLQPYTITHWRQRLGRFLLLLIWSPMLLVFIKLTGFLVDDTGKLPAGLATLLSMWLNLMWLSYEFIFKPIFGDGERTEAANDDDMEASYRRELHHRRPQSRRRMFRVPPLLRFYHKMPASLLGGHTRKHKVTIVGSGNWGSTIAKIVAENTRTHNDIFEEAVQMWVFEENVLIPPDSKHYQASFPEQPQKLTSVINSFHENVKYLPGITLPPNLVANPSIVEAVRDSTILIFNLPHQFIGNVCDQIRGHILPFARGISCIKGVNVSDDAVSLFSEWIGDGLNIYVGALSGANIANEIAAEKWSETTIAYDPPPMDSRAPSPRSGSPLPGPGIVLTEAPANHHRDARGRTSKTKLTPLPAQYPPLDHECFRLLFHRPYFHVQMVSDVAGVSLGGALKNIVALAAGFVDGRGWGDNAKAAIMRIGLMEMVKFGKEFFGETVQSSTFTETSAGVADLITSCSGGRNFRCARKAVDKGISVDEVEKQDLNGQKLQGTTTAYEVNSFLLRRGLEKEYPLFTAVNDILRGKKQVDDIPQLVAVVDED
ncbi:hypothetical protein CP533_6798 [Ophiocordyceps camponoti-saundersi (nom. inval.)]|nr:hypothetical protein CP533_6798 [Ophiocordyceps camponoti-saundersi (nom. inval.)]